LNKGKKNIKIISYNNFPFGGASANFVRNFAFSIAKLNVEVLLPTGSLYGNIFEKINIRKGRIGSISFRYLCYLKHPANIFSKSVDIFFGTIRLYIEIVLMKIKREIDIVIKYDITFTTDFILLIILKILKIKIIYIFVEFYEKPKKSVFSIELMKWYSFYIGFNYLSKYGDGAVVLSFYLKNYLQTKVVYRKPIIVQPNLVDCKSFNCSNKSKIYDAKFKRIGYCGVIAKKDGIYDLLHSFEILLRKYPQTHLLIIGDVTNGGTIVPELKGIASSLNILDNIIFTGLVPTGKIPELLNSCDILTLPRQTGVFAEAGFPTKLGEYFACKKPVVVSKVGDIKKYFTNYKEVVLVEPENPLSLAEGFEYLIKNEDKSSLIAENGFNWMKQNLDYNIFSIRIYNLIEEL
jgi:glycosyltransferase involved in cell wall biosynthesis